MVNTGIALALTALCWSALLSEIGASRNHGQRPLLGGWRPVNVTSSIVQEVGRKAVTHLEAVKNTAMGYRLHRILSGKSQIVSGVNYNLLLMIAQTDCTRSSGVNLESCQAVKVQRCNVTIHVPLQQQPTQMMNYNCGQERRLAPAERAGGGSSRRTTTTRHPRPLPGGNTEIDVSSEVVKQAAAFAMEELSSRANGRYQVQQRRIVKAESQIVAGVMYHLTIEVSVNFSQNNERKTTSCYVKVWDQAWRTPRYVLSEYKCDGHIA